LRPRATRGAAEPDERAAQEPDPGGWQGRVAKRAYRAAAASLPADGALSPTVAVVQGDELTRKRAQLDRLQDLLARQPGVAAVIRSGTAPGLPARDVVLTRDGEAARILVVLEDDPLGADAVEALGGLGSPRGPNAIPCSRAPHSSREWARSHAADGAGETRPVSAEDALMGSRDGAWERWVAGRPMSCAGRARRGALASPAPEPPGHVRSVTQAGAGRGRRGSRGAWTSGSPKG
jgi:hypothetical protein